MRECAMASLSSLEHLPTTDEEDGPTMHPEMLEEQPRSIPDTASEFLSQINESALERYQRERKEAGSDVSSSASTDADTPRPGTRLLSCMPGAGCTLC